MGKKLYVGNLAYSTTEDDLRDTFAKIGEVASAKLIIDPTNGRSKGFGFVEMGSDDDAQKAISQLNGTDLHGRTITVNEARPPKERGGGGYGGGGYGGGGRGGERRGGGGGRGGDRGGWR
ncbi:MAG: RNA-binding protein [Nitrospirota bacterium]|nr:RNA-binding protein [Nitrospirota bacterium]